MSRLDGEVSPAIEAARFWAAIEAREDELIALVAAAKVIGGFLLEWCGVAE